MTRERARLLNDDAANGAWNMAVDQALLRSVEDSGLTTLRFYRWNTPTLSLGYFQKYEDRQQHPSSSNCDVVRRSSGGGAILHDREVTYSLCVPSLNRWSRLNTELYELVHQEIIDVLKSNAIDAHLYADSKSQIDRSVREKNPFLCFQRRTRGDILIGRNKIGGSAQRRLKRSLLQHGSLLLQQSPNAPELAGIEELSSVSIAAHEFCNQLTERLAESMGLDFFSSKLSQIELDHAAEIESSKFGSELWTQQRE